MPYIFTRTNYPANKADEVVKKYLEVMEKYPPDESLGEQIVPVASNTSFNGLESLSITKVEIPKLGEALERAKAAMAEYRNIEGFFTDISVWSTVEEALGRMGIK
jgi:hypothetical protein